MLFIKTGSYCPSPNPFVNFTYDLSASEYVGTYLVDGELCPPGTYNSALDLKHLTCVIN